MVMLHTGFNFVMPEDVNNYELLVEKNEPECVYCGNYVTDCICD